MPAKTAPGRRPDPVRQFSIFIANRVGRLHEVITLLESQGILVLAMTVLDTTDSSIIRVVVSDPETARDLLRQHDFAFTESELLVVAIHSTTELGTLMGALLEAELNVNYFYTFIPHPQGKSILAFSMEDNELAEQALRRRQFQVLRQSDISR